jgi:shikimate dehydrogenase
VGRAITASLAAAGVGSLSLFDVDDASVQGLAARVREHYPDVSVQTGSRDLDGHDLVVNATPLGMNEADPMPVDVQRLSPTTFVGEVVMKRETTPLLAAAQARGCRVQVGTDMLYEQIPAYLEFFGLPTTTAAELRRLSQVSYA